jgi:hypothetical protein
MHAKHTREKFMEHPALFSMPDNLLRRERLEVIAGFEGERLLSGLLFHVDEVDLIVEEVEEKLISQLRAREISGQFELEIEPHAVNSGVHADPR